MVLGLFYNKAVSPFIRIHLRSEQLGDKDILTSPG